MQKFRETLGSKNFLVSLISIFVLALNSNGAGIPDGASEYLADAIVSADLNAILSVIFVNFANPLFKIIKSKKFDGGFLKSVNFWVQSLTVGLMVAVGYGFSFPESAASEIVNAIFGGNVGAIITALVINIGNPLWHFFQKAKGEKVREPVPQTASSFY